MNHVRAFPGILFTICFVLVNAAHDESKGQCGDLMGRLPDFPDHNVGEWSPLGDISLYLQRLNEGKHPVVFVSLKNIKCPSGCCRISVFIRPKATDFTIMQNVFGGEYYFLLDKVDFNPVSVLDAGSNVGMASLLFALFYPKATVIAVEPQANNYDILLLNTERFGNIKAVNKGLWSKNTFLEVSAPKHSDQFHSGDLHLSASERQDAYTVREVHASKSNVQAISIESLLSQYQLPSFQLMKVDIEGAEKHVFAHHRHGIKGDPSSRDWLDGVRLLVAETHDRFVPGSSAAIQTVAESLQRPFNKAAFSEFTIWDFAPQAPK